MIENENNNQNPNVNADSSADHEVPFDGQLPTDPLAQGTPVAQEPYQQMGGPIPNQGQNPPSQMGALAQYPPMNPQPPMQAGSPIAPDNMAVAPQNTHMPPNQQQMPPQAQQAPSQAEQPKPKQEGRHAAHAKAAQSAFIQRSSKMRKLYVAIIILGVIIVVAIAVLAARMIWTADNSAMQQTQITSTDLDEAAEANDTEENDTPKTTVPNIVELLGKTRKQALEMIGHGAEVVSNRSIKEQGNPIRRELRIELTDEPSDSKSGAPTVYLSLNKSGKAIHVGYSVSISSLGYGSASFSDTVESEHIVENTLGEAGLTVEPGSAVLPEDVTKYTSYSSDGATVTKEYCSFSGTGKAGSKTYDWEAVLSYDYTVANASDNLNDTLRTIFVYVS